MKMKRFRVSELEPVARDATREALKACVPPSDEDRKLLTLGTMFTDEAVVFELYVPGERPRDGRVISRATVNRTTGELVNVEVFLPKL